MKIKKGIDAIVLPEVIDADTAQVIFYSDNPKTNPNATAIMLYRVEWKDFCKMRTKREDDAALERIAASMETLVAQTPFR